MPSTIPRMSLRYRSINTAPGLTRMKYPNSVRTVVNAIRVAIVTREESVLLTRQMMVRIVGKGVILQENTGRC
jgi:hypothetical protein